MVACALCSTTYKSYKEIIREKLNTEKEEKRLF